MRSYEKIDIIEVYFNYLHQRKEVAEISRIKTYHLGRTIKNIRLERNMTRLELAQDICSDKYILMIEKGERNPSNFILSKLSDKLNANLTDLEMYENCIEPVKVRDYYNKFTLYRGLFKIDELKTITEEALKMTDFQSLPWNSEIIINNAYILIAKDRNINEAIRIIHEGIVKLAEYRNIDIGFQLRLKLHKALFYQHLHNHKEALNLIEELFKKSHKSIDARFIRIHGDIIYYWIQMYLGNCKDLLKNGQELLEEIKTAGFYTTTPKFYMLLAMAYHKNNEVELSRSYLEKAFQNFQLEDTDPSFINMLKGFFKDY